MPTLNWREKGAVVKHYKDAPYRLLEPVAELYCGDSRSEDMIEQGDNLFEIAKICNLLL
jgi:adenine-specific DNA-methyltransferase